MPPLEWVKKIRKIGFHALALEFGLGASSTATVWRTANGKHEVSYAMMVRFYEASGGLVALDDWIELRRPKDVAKKRKAK